MKTEYAETVQVSGAWNLWTAGTIGGNVRRLRESRRIGQTEMVAKLQLRQVPITRETLVKIEGGRQHIKLAQLRGIRDVLGVSYEDILDN